MGLSAKCMHFVGSPGWRGRNIPRETCTLYLTFEHAAASERVLYEFT